MSHRRRFVAIAAVTAVLLTAGSTGAAELASKRFKFSPNQTLTVSLASGPVTVRSVLFEFPSAVLGFRGAHRARILVVNGGEAAVRLGLSVALYDDQDRLVGVASAGTKGTSLKPGRETHYSLSFHHLTAHVESASTFFLAIETSTD